MKEILKSTQKLRVNESKQIEYTKKIVKEISVGKYLEAGDKYNSIIKIMGEDWTWQDIRHGN